MPLYEASGRQTPIFDIGSAYTKLGFCGEFAPRCIIKSGIRCKTTGKFRKILDYQDTQDLYDLLVEFIHTLYFKYVLLSPKDRPLVIVESLLCPTLFRETLAAVLFKHFEISNLLIVPSHLVALSTLAIETGLVIDVGYSESVCIPVCHGMPIIHAWQALPHGASAIHNNLRSMLSVDNGNVNIEEDVLENIKVRCCFVTKKNRAQQLADSKTTLQPAPAVDYPVEGSNSLKVTGKVRELAYEMFFEEDLDHLSLTSMLLEAILKVNVDLRKSLAENIVIVGGTSMAPGFKARLREELVAMLESERYKQLRCFKFKFHTAPCKENYTAWLGGSIYGNTELVSMKGTSKETFLNQNRLSDWVHLGDNRTS